MRQRFHDSVISRPGGVAKGRDPRGTRLFDKREDAQDEAFGLRLQLRRAAVSIPSNIAEGKAISGRAYLRHLRIALGSEAELQTQIELAARLKMLTESDANSLLSEASEVGRMLMGLLKSLIRTTRS
jgi:four helix bundle protein